MMEQFPKPNGYKGLEQRKDTGAHYTPTELAEFVSEQMFKSWSDLVGSGPVNVLDPAIGDGELIRALLHQLKGMNFGDIIVSGFDTDSAAAEKAKNRLSHEFNSLTIEIKVENFLDYVLQSSQYDLFSQPMVDQFDLVISNPPYVRTQVMGAPNSQDLAQKFGLIGRADLYHAFLKGIATVLKPGGIAGIIVSNRFMTTKSGQGVRRDIRENFEIIHVWDLGDTKLFEAAVLPAVILLRKKDGTSRIEKPMFTTIYSSENEAAKVSKFPSVFQAINQDGVARVESGDTFEIRQGFLDLNTTSDDVWRLSNVEIDSWLEKVKQNTFCTFGELGKIRVGVKTTADKVFIRDDWDTLPTDTQPELLKPLVTHHMARNFKANEISRPKQILYTHKMEGNKRIAIELKDYPKAARYLNQHRELLEKREYVTQSGRNWYEIWVPQDPKGWEKPKLVFTDISDRPTVWLDLSGSVINGDCYWLSAARKEEIGNDNLLWLALAIGNSSFISEFYDRSFNNKLYSNRRRFMTQYVENFPLPDPDLRTSKEIIALCKQIYSENLDYTDPKVEQLNQLVYKAFAI